MTNINEIRFSGTAERLQAITTKSGNSMATLLLKVGHDKFKVVAFKNVADALLRCNDGDQISITGKGSINSWKDNEGHWHNDFQVTAWAAEIDGQQISYQKANADKQAPQQQSDMQPPDKRVSDRLEDYTYTGGPF